MNNIEQIGAKNVPSRPARTDRGNLRKISFFIGFLCCIKFLWDLGVIHIIRSLRRLVYDPT